MAGRYGDGIKDRQGGTSHGGSLHAAGPVIGGGILYVNSGYASAGGMPGNVLLAFSVDGKSASVSNELNSGGPGLQKSPVMELHPVKRPVFLCVAECSRHAAEAVAQRPRDMNN